jgi:ATP-dependent Clp protease protease subunit
MRCFEGNAQPHEAFWGWRDAVEGEEPEMELYGYISEYSWFEDDVTPGMFKQDLYAKGNGGPITVRINSYGGDVIAASMIRTMIRDYPGKVTVQIDGVAASAATVVALGGDVVRIQNTGYFMIHDPSVVFFLAQLNIEDLTRLASSLQAVKEGIINAYEEKTGLSRPRLSKLMTDETWLDAQRAADLGFVDEVIQGEKKKVIVIPEHTAVVNAVASYRNVPKALLEAIKNEFSAEAAGTSEPRLTLEKEREAQDLRKQVQTILKRSE